MEGVITCFKQLEIRGMHSLSVIVFSERLARLCRLYIISTLIVQESPKLVQVCWQSSRHFPSLLPLRCTSSKPILETLCGKITASSPKASVSSTRTQQM